MGFVAMATTLRLLETTIHSSSLTSNVNDTVVWINGL